MSIFLAACSQEDDFNAGGSQGKEAEKEYVYNMHFYGDAPGYSEDKTRATTSWDSGSVVYLWFKNGTSYVYGTATYKSGKWELKANAKIPTASSYTECKAVYVTNPTSVTSTSLTLSSKSIYYYALGSYKCSSTDIYVKATLKPNVWRLRFKGSSGQKITLPSTDNDIKFYSKIYLSSTFSETTQKEDISLTVNSNGYTDYIYGMFTYPSGSNKLYVKNDTEGKEYYITSFSGSKLATGKSGYLTIPTSSNYSSNGWKKYEYINQNATVQTDEMYAFTDGMCTNWKFGSSAYKFYYKVYPSASSYLKNDDDLVNHLKINGYYLVSEYKDNIFRTDLTSNTSYCLCAVAYDQYGNRGPILKKTFTTRKTTDPIAEITNIQYYPSSYKWEVYVTKKNGAAKYYCMYSKVDWHYHFVAWEAYHCIKTGTISKTFSSSPTTFTLNYDKVNVTTVAVNNYGTLGNCDVWQVSRTKSSGVEPVNTKDYSKGNVGCMKISELKNIISVPIDESFYVKRP